MALSTPRSKFIRVCEAAPLFTAAVPSELLSEGDEKKLVVKFNRPRTPNPSFPLVCWFLPEKRKQIQKKLSARVDLAVR